MIESFVYRELAAQVDQSLAAMELFHWRQGSSEADLLLSSGDRTVAIEIKAARTIPRRAFQGINKFANNYPKRLIRGLLFYTGDEVVPLGERRLAVPISALWAT